VTARGVATKGKVVELWPVVLVDASQLMDGKSGAVDQVAETEEATGTPVMMGDGR